MRPVFIVGFMATGKSTLGRAVASRCHGLKFYDLDEVIEQEEGMTVATIFATKGQDYFRLREAEALRKLASLPQVLISCGGGTPCYGNNMEFMKDSGVVVCLDAGLDTICRRIIEAGPTRPLASKYADEPDRLKAHVEEMLNARKYFYSLAHEKFSGELLETEEDVDKTANEFISRYLNEDNRKPYPS